MDAEVRCPRCGAAADGGAVVCAACGAQLGSEDAAGQISDGGRGRYERPAVTPARLALLGINLALFVICAALTASQFLLPPTPAHRLSPAAPTAATASGTAPAPEATSAAEPGSSSVAPTATARTKGSGAGTGQLPTATPTATLPPTTPAPTAASTAAATATPTPTPGQSG